MMTSMKTLEPDFTPAHSPDACGVWNQIVAPKYARFERTLVDSASAHSRQVRTELPGAELAVDVGCGFGDTSAELAEHCGQVVGVDCSELLCALAKDRYPQVGNLSFVAQDVGRYVPPKAAELVFSRFGLMFFERPVQALRHIRSWMKPGAALRTLVWGPREENPWLESGKRAVSGLLPPIDQGAPNCGPGPFSLSSPETAQGILEAAGFHSIVARRLYADVSLGSAEDAARFQLAMGPVGEVVRHAQERNHPAVEVAFDALKRFFAEYEGPEGVVLRSTSWWLQATA